MTLLANSAKPEESTLSAKAAYSFVTQLKEDAGEAALDSVVHSLSGNGNVPEHYEAIRDWFASLDSANPGYGLTERLASALVNGAKGFEALHGREASGDLIEQALQNGYAWTLDAANKYKQSGFSAPAILDSATLTSGHQSNDYYRAEAILVSMITTIATAPPFPSYLPINVGSQTAHLAILRTSAANSYGAYKEGDSLDGVNNGDKFLFASRYHQCEIKDDGTCVGKLTAIQKDTEYCDPAGADVKLQAGRSRILVNGVECGRETNFNAVGWSQVSGVAIIDGTSYSISGRINIETGNIELATSPKIPVSATVGVEGFIDYQRAPDIIPGVMASVDKYTLNASACRAYVKTSFDSESQAKKELGLSLSGESLRSLQNQFGNERHYELLAMAMRVGKHHSKEYNFDWDRRGAQLSRAQILPELATTLGIVDHDMVTRTNAFGIGFIYVGKYLASLLMQMPPEIFQKSGLSVRPGVFRLGRLFGSYEVYYSPRLVREGITDGRQWAQMLCIGKSPDTARAPFIIGDATPAFLEEVGKDLTFRDGHRFYHSGYTTTNPHTPSASGAALVSIMNLS